MIVKPLRDLCIRVREAEDVSYPGHTRDREDEPRCLRCVRDTNKRDPPFRCTPITLACFASRIAGCPSQCQNGKTVKNTKRGNGKQPKRTGQPSQDGLQVRNHLRKLSCYSQMSNFDAEAKVRNHVSQDLSSFTGASFRHRNKHMIYVSVMYIYIYIYTCIRLSLHICTNIYIYIYMYTHIHTYIYPCIYIYIYTHIHTHV